MTPQAEIDELRATIAALHEELADNRALLQQARSILANPVGREHEMVVALKQLLGVV